MQRIKNIKLFCTDMDGTLFLGNKLFPWTLSFLKRVKDTGRQLLVLTNNSSKAKKDWVEKLNNMGIKIDGHNVFTSGEATALTLKKRKPNAKLYIAGTLELISEFAEYGFRFTSSDPDFCVLGFDTSMTYEKMRVLCDLVRQGYPYIATHPDPNCPTDHGPIPDIGAMIEFVARSTGRYPDEIIGKPNKGMLEAASEKMSVPINQIAMVGDMLPTDMLLANNAGALGVLVMSGETRTEDIGKLKGKPDIIIKNIGEITRYL